MTLRSWFPNVYEYAIQLLTDAQKDIEDPSFKPSQAAEFVSMRMTRLYVDLRTFVRIVTRKEYESVYLAMRQYSHEVLNATLAMHTAIEELVTKKTEDLTTLREAHAKLMAIIQREIPTHPDLD